MRLGGGTLAAPTGVQRYEFAVRVLSQEVREQAAKLVARVRPGSVAAFMANTYEVRYVTSRREAQDLAASLRGDTRPMGFDFETSGWSPSMKRTTLSGETKTVDSFSPSQPDVSLTPIIFQIYAGEGPVYVVAGEHLHMFMPWLRDEAVLDGANLPFEGKVVRRAGGRIPRVHRDVVHMDYLLEETTRQWQHGLKEVTRDRLGLDPLEFKHTTKGKSFETILAEDPRLALEYASFDAWDSTFAADVLQALLMEQPSRAGYDSLWDYYCHVERSYGQAVAHIDEVGLPVLPEITRRKDGELAKAIETTDAQCYAAVGRPINLSSNKDLNRYFYKERAYPVASTTAGWECLICDKKITSRTDNVCREHGRGALVNTPQVDETALDIFTGLGDPLAPLLIERRGLDKQRSSYVEPFFTRSSQIPAAARHLYPWACDCPEVRVMHPSLNATDIVSGRLGAPLALTIPKVGFKDQVGFSEESPWTLVDIDFAQIELRIMAELSGDAMLLEAFAEKRDLHAWTGALVEAYMRHGDRALTDATLRLEIYKGIRAAKVAKEAGEPLTGGQRALLKRRDHGKTLNFAVLYGAGDDKLAQSLGVTTDEAKRIREAIMKMYSGMAEFIERGFQELVANPVLITLGGRHRTIIEVRSPEAGTREEGRRLSTNQRCQGGARDVLALAKIQADVDIEAGGGYGREGRGSYGHWVDGRYVLDFDRLPKRWREELPPALAENLGALGRMGARIINSIHDELLLVCPKAYVVEVAEHVQVMMENAGGLDLQLKVPIVAEYSIGHDWQVCKGAG